MLEGIDVHRPVDAECLGDVARHLGDEHLEVDLRRAVQPDGVHHRRIARHRPDAAQNPLGLRRARRRAADEQGLADRINVDGSPIARDVRDDGLGVVRLGVHLNDIGGQEVAGSAVNLEGGDADLAAKHEQRPVVQRLHIRRSRIGDEGSADVGLEIDCGGAARRQFQGPLGG